VGLPEHTPPHEQQPEGPGVGVLGLMYSPLHGPSQFDLLKLHQELGSVVLHAPPQAQHICLLVGDFVGAFVGILVGDFVGDFVGILVGDFVGAFVGTLVGAKEGAFVGIFVGFLVGSFVGVIVESFVG